MHREEQGERHAMRGFMLATIAFLAVFAATAVPIPLYADYQVTIGLTTADISNTMFTYLSGVALTLLFFGRISDALGRKPVTVFTIGLAMIGCVMFMVAQNGAAVLFARFVQGLSAGLCMSAVSALVIDCAGERHMSWGSAVASCGAMFGVMLGSVGAGVLYDVLPDIYLMYALMIAVLAVCLILVPFVREPNGKSSSLRAAVRVRVYVPGDNRRLFAVVGICYVGTWMVACYFQSFASPIAYDCFGEASPLASSIILALVMAPSLLGGPLMQRFEPNRTLVVSMAMVTLTTALLAVFIALGAEVAFMVDCAVFSFAMGVAVAVSLRLLLLRVSVLRVSAVLSSVNLVAYAGSAVSGELAGMLLEATSYTVVFGIMAVLLVGASLFVGVCVAAPREPKRDSRLTFNRFRRLKNEGSDQTEAQPATAEGKLRAGSEGKRRSAAVPNPFDDEQPAFF